MDYLVRNSYQKANPNEPNPWLVGYVYDQKFPLMK